MDIFTIIGLLAATCTTIAFLPQAIKVINTRNTEDISLIMYIVMAIGVALWLTYGIAIENLPIMAANGVSLVFVVTILALKLRYKSLIYDEAGFIMFLPPTLKNAYGL